MVRPSAATQPLVAGPDGVSWPTSHRENSSTSCPSPFHTLLDAGAYVFTATTIFAS
jgi:hypothetical protein